MIPEHIKNYKTFNELSIVAQKKAKREERLFCLKNNFKEDTLLNQLFNENGKLAGMTIEERNSWFLQ